MFKENDGSGLHNAVDDHANEVVTPKSLSSLKPKQLVVIKMRSNEKGCSSAR